MRLIVASPPKTGNIWLKNLLIGAYDLKQGDAQPLDTYEDFVEFIKGDRFDDDTVIHLHPEPTDAYFELADSVGATTITILRNPYDVFVSLYHYVQRFKDELTDIGDPLSEMIDKDLEDEAAFNYLMGNRSIEQWGRVYFEQYGKAEGHALPIYRDYVRNYPDLLKAYEADTSGLNEDVANIACWGRLHYNNQGKAEGRTLSTKVSYTDYVWMYPELLSAYHAQGRGGFGDHLLLAEAWLNCKRSIIVRYEDLLEHSADHLWQLCQQIAPVSLADCETAFQLCTPERLRTADNRMERHVRTATAGSGQRELCSRHLKIFRDRYRTQIENLGYDVL